MTAEMNGEGASHEPLDRQRDWWKTVTPLALRQAPAVVADFIEGSGAALPFDIEGFARALALQQLFFDEDAVWLASDEAYNLMPSDPRESPGGLVKAQAWLPRGTAIETGLLWSLELLLPREDGRWKAAVDRFAIRLHLFRLGCVEARVHSGLEEELTFKKPSRPRRRGAL